MNAVEFVKKFGICEAKRIVEYRDNHAKSTRVFKFNKSCVDKGVINGGAYLYTKSYNDYSVSVGDLKQIVDAFELVETGLPELKKVMFSNSKDLDYVKNWILTVSDKLLTEKGARLKQAINLMEQCQ